MLGDLPVDTCIGAFNTAVEGYSRRFAALEKQHERVNELERVALAEAEKKDTEARAVAVRANKPQPKTDAATETVKAAIQEARRQAAGYEAALAHDKAELVELVAQNQKAWAVEAKKAEATALSEYNAAIAALDAARAHYSKTVQHRLLIEGFPNVRHREAPATFRGQIAGETPKWGTVFAALEQDGRREAPTKVSQMPRREPEPAGAAA